MKENYIKATLDLINSGQTPESVIDGLKKSLKKHGHDRLLRSVLLGVSRVLRAKRPNEVVVITASTADFDSCQKTIKDELSKLNITDQTITNQIDKTLIGGYIIEGNNQRLNNSYKHKLVKLYRTLTE
jgi:F0F1-type ATP synthase delta subunit